MTTEILSRRNNWWATGKSSYAPLYKTARDELKTVVNGLDARRIQIITGPRRVGKSTLIQHTIAFLLENGVEPKRILFLSCDDPTVFGGKTTIGDVIEFYAANILYEAIPTLGARIYIFIDEIHISNDWQLWLKNYYEPQYDIKFIACGSSVSQLFDNAKESLLGRTDTLHLMPLSFIQFCKFWSIYKKAEKIDEYLREIPEGSLYEDPFAYFNELVKSPWKWDAFKPYVNAVLNEFLLIGGYPEYFSDDNTALWQKRLVEDIISHGLYRDVVGAYKIKTPDKLERLLFFIAANYGKSYNMKSIADSIGCDNETVSAYLSYLSRAYMAVVLQNYVPNASKALRQDKTLYVFDNGIANALLRLSEVDETRAAHIVESVCAKDAMSACEKNLWKLYYWREKDYEIDLVIDRKTDSWPVEVLYGPGRAGNSLAAFRKTFYYLKVPVSIVITKDRLEKDQDTLYIPFWLAR